MTIILAWRGNSAAPTPESNMTVYQAEGYKNRTDYLRGLADEIGVDEKTVFMMADLLGEEEDFDGLVTSLEDYAEGL